jgi:aerobic carbon-monoxide dehydrogenase large subunit
MSGEPGAAARFGSGRAVRRIEDPALVAGRGRFTDNLPAQGSLHLVFVRSMHAHARLLSVDTAAARAMPGVVAVWTGADLAAAGVKPLPSAVPFKRPDGRPAASAPRHALAQGVLRFVGEAVAAVVARSRAEAEAAAEAVMVDVDMLEAVVDPFQAMHAGAPQLCEAAPDNISAQARHGDEAAASAAFAEAAHTVSLKLVNQRLAPSPMEPRAVLAQIEPGTGRLLVDLSSQMPTAVRDGLAALLPGLKPEQVQVRVGDVGGGFGMKGGIYPEDVVVGFAALQLKQPVKWVARRLEDFVAAAHGRDLVSHAELALDAHGKVLALRVRSVANVGAYGTTVGVLIPLLIGPWVATSIYDIRCIDFHLTAVMTHTTPVGAYRGAGRPEAIYVIERLMDAAAQRLQLDPAELRRRNLIRPEQMPYTNPMQQVYDCGQFESMLDQALALADWAGFEARREASARTGRLRGRGLASFLEWTGGNVLQESVTVKVRGDGIIELTSATQAMGQGIATSYAQLAVDVFGVPIECIRVLQGDTDRATGFGSAGSRSLFTGGGAVKVASERTIDHAKGLAGEALEAARGDIEFRDGRFNVVGTDLAIGLFELARRQPGQQVVITADASAGAPSWPNACHVCEVEIDPATGEVALVAYASVNDVGRVISPAIVQGQIEGGAVQGVGQALCEQVLFDEHGQALTASFMDYAMPRVDGFRAYKTVLDSSVPCLTNVLGAKGVGELGTIGATPAVANAVVDALGRAGLGAKAQAVQMPFTAPKVWHALQGHIDPLPPI